MKEFKQQPLLFTVAEYNDLKSLSSFITIGRNIERAGFSEFSNVKDRDDHKYNDLDFLHEFIAHLLTVSKDTNNVDKGSIEYLNTSIHYMEGYKNRLVKRILDPEESKEFLKKPWLHHFSVLYYWIVVKFHSTEIGGSEYAEEPEEASNGL